MLTDYLCLNDGFSISCIFFIYCMLVKCRISGLFVMPQIGKTGVAVMHGVESLSWQISPCHEMKETF